jgi:hypothetical protein
MCFCLETIIDKHYGKSYGYRMCVWQYIFWFVYKHIFFCLILPLSLSL